MFILASVYNNADNISDSYDGFKNLTVNRYWLDVKTLIFWRTLIPCSELQEPESRLDIELRLESSLTI